MPDKLSPHHLQEQGKNGGWPYFEGNAPATEATVYCALASLHNNELAKSALHFLLKAQNSDGGWSSGNDLGESDWNTGLALFAIARILPTLKAQKKLSDTEETNAANVYRDSALKLVGMRADPMPELARTVLTAVSGPDFDYPRGWPWESRTFHWVEPTSYALLAIKAGGLYNEKPFKKVIESGHSYLFEKVCKGGGWNWGQTHTLGFDFVATPRATAFALLALQDQKDHEKVQQALAVLRKGEHPESGTITAQALSIIARDALGEDMLSDINALQKRHAERLESHEDLCTRALAIIASEIPQQGNPFKLNLQQESGQ